VRVHRRNAWWQDAALVVAVCALVAGSLDARGARAAETLVSNLDLMEDLTGQVFDELYGKMEGSLKGRTVRLKPFASGEDYTFVGNVITDRLVSRGVTVIPPQPVAPAGTYTGAAPAPAPAADEVVLQYQAIAFGVRYPDTYRSFWVGGKNVIRRADVRVLATLTDTANGSVLWMGEAARDHEDEFSAGDAAAMEQGTYAFAHPAAPTSSWTRFVEPVFVTGIIVGLVYLFFSNQSEN